MANTNSIRPPNGTRIGIERHASEGIGKAYPKEVRELVLALVQNGDNPNNDPAIQLLQIQHKFPSSSTINRWMNQWLTTGHLLPKRRTGNKRAERELCGREIVDLALFRTLKPKAHLAELNAYIFNRSLDPDNHQFHSHSQLVRGEQRLDIRMVRASTTAFQAFFPINLQKRDNYWYLPYPYGMVGIATDDTIDLDECGLFLEMSKRKYGKVFRGLRASQAGPYTRTDKVNLLMAILGDRNNPMRWEVMWTDGGTTIILFYHFLTRIINDLAQRYPGRCFTFTMDNLNSHKNPVITSLIYNSGHRLVYRAPYYAVDGPIEYIFNTIQAALTWQLGNINNTDELIQAVRDIIASIPSFREYFVHVGFL